MRDKSGLQMRRGGLWVCSSAWCGKGHRPNEEIVQNAVRVVGEIKERVCVHSLWLAKPEVERTTQ